MPASYILIPVSYTHLDPTDNIGGLSVSTDLKNNEVSAKGGSFFLQIKTDGKWTASSQDSWCTINNKEGNGNASTICSVSANDDDERYTVITVTSNGKSENITITQKGGNGEEMCIRDRPHSVCFQSLRFQFVCPVTL